MCISSLRDTDVFAKLLNSKPQINEDQSLARSGLSDKISSQSATSGSDTSGTAITTDSENAEFLELLSYGKNAMFLLREQWVHIDMYQIMGRRFFSSLILSNFSWNIFTYFIYNLYHCRFLGLSTVGFNRIFMSR
jgi:hypothetical protein